MKLGVNIDHVATLRQARYRGLPGGEPDPVEAARICLGAGADGITAHLREDRRHIQDRDIRALREVVRNRFNLEMGNHPGIVDLALEVKPEIVCLVPENREEVTTEGGLNVSAQLEALTRTRKRMNDAGIEVSFFITPDPGQIRAAAAAGAQFIELHTGALAEAFKEEEARAEALDCLRAAAGLARSLGVRVNAGHGLNYENVTTLHTVPHLEELNIGHSIVSRAIVTGLAQAVREMRSLIGAA